MKIYRVALSTNYSDGSKFTATAIFKNNPTKNDVINELKKLAEKNSNHLAYLVSQIATIAANDFPNNSSGTFCKYTDLKLGDTCHVRVVIHEDDLVEN